MTMENVDWIFEAIGTRWEITPAPSAESHTKVSEIISEFDSAYSRFRKDSAVWRLALTGKVKLPGFFRMHKTYRTLWKLSSGAVNPLVGESLNALGYDASYSLSVGSPVPAPSLENLNVEADGLITAPVGSLLDIGAIGKGELIDLVFDSLSESGWVGVVDAGRDMRISPGHPIRIALENPENADEAIGIVELEGKAIAASATNRRAWKGLHHIIDARTGLPTTEVSATWAIADSAIHADAIASALFFATPKEIAEAGEFGKFEYVRIFSGGTVEFWLPSGEVFTS